MIFRAFTISVLACVLLMACSHRDELVSVTTGEDVAETIDLTVKADVESGAQGDITDHKALDLSALSAHISDGRVRVYDLFGGENKAGKRDVVSSPVGVAVGGQAVATNPYVWIYPVEDDAAAPVAQAKNGESVGSDDYIALSFGEGRSLKIHFDHNSALIRPANRTILGEIAQHVKNNAGDVSVEGHASRHVTKSNATRRIMSNLKISINRAYNVAEELVRLGVPAQSIRLVGWGEMRLPADGEDGEEARRVEILPF